MAIRSRITVTLALLLGVLLHGAAAGAADIEAQRQLFIRVYPEVERGNWGVIDALPAANRQALQDYILWPDLRATWLRASIDTADRAEIDDFLEHYGSLRPARELRYRYAMHLAEAGDLGAYLPIYQQFYQGMGIARLDCLALQAELEAGRGDRIANRAIDLWTVGESQAEECDPVFAYLAKNGLLDVTDYAKRFDLAVDARQFSLAQWLAASIDQRHVEIAAQWLAADSDPETFVRTRKQRESTDAAHRQLVYAIERITYRDPQLALRLWQSISGGRGFSAEQQLRTDRHIALWFARKDLAGAYDLLTSLPAAAQNSEVLRWRARASLRSRNWANLIADIDSMSYEERNSEEWRYWRGIALRREGQPETGDPVLAALATTRSYYGFLAADELELPYALAAESFAPDEPAIAALAASPALLRARELFLVGQDGRGRSEWDTVISELPPERKMQAAILAQRWGWHSRAIAAAASIGQFEDLALRYPLPFEETFLRYSEEAEIPPTWAYGVARSESLFMRDVRSRAGAVGLMQLMPATGRKVADEIRLQYSGLDTLTDPQSNIRLGTSYLAQMSQRFGGNRVLATAAYNAGPQRVQTWLPLSGELDARIWIENIPFNETRSYVRRVLEAETIFQWRMTGRASRLSERMRAVASAAQAQLAVNQ